MLPPPILTSIILSIIVKMKEKSYEEGFENTAVLAKDEKNPLGG